MRFLPVYLDELIFRLFLNKKSFQMYAREATDPGTQVKVGVGVIIVDDDGKILLERRRDNGLWGLPGGGIEPGESVVDAATREVKEETNLDVRITGLVGVYSEPSAGRIVTYPDNGDVRHLVDIVLKAEIVCGELTVGDESLELTFFVPSTFPADIVPPAVDSLKDYLEGKGPTIR